MKVYEAKLRKNTDVNSFSLVLGAAVETVLSKFAEEKETPTFFANQEKRIIYSVAMRPDKMIFRKDVNGEPANVYFTADTVEQIQQSYFKNNNKGLVKMNINHADEVVEGVYPIESWIVNDPEVDKSKTLMMQDVKAKDLIIGYKIDNNDVWENFVKTGEVDGLSVEAYLDYEINDKINMKDEEKKSLFAQFKAWFAEEAPTPPADEKPEDEKPADPLKELQDKVDTLTAENADLKEKLAGYQSKEVEANAELETMKAEKAKFEAEKMKAETELATFKAENAGIKNLPSNEPAKKYEDMTNFEKVKFNKENKL